MAAIISRTYERFWFVRVLNEDLVAVSRHDEGPIVRGVCEVAQRGHRAVFPDTHVFLFHYCLRQFGGILYRAKIPYCAVRMGICCYGRRPCARNLIRQTWS